MPGDPPEPRHAHPARPRAAADERGRDRAGGRGAHDLRAAVARPDADRDDRQRLRGQPRAPAASRTTDVHYLLDAVNAFFETDFGLGDLAGAYAGVRPLISTGDPKKSVDISRKAELYETSSGHDHDHRRQAHDLAADGEDDRRPARRARVPRGALPHARDPARPSGRPARRCRTRRRRRRALARAPGEPLRAVRRAGAGALRRDARARRGRSSRACPTCSSRRSSPRATSRRARSPDVLLRRTRLGLLAGRRLVEDRDAVERVAEVMARRARLGQARTSSAQAERVARDGRGRSGSSAARAACPYEPTA